MAVAKTPDPPPDAAEYRVVGNERIVEHEVADRRGA
jgi:hypothetical protein